MVARNWAYSLVFFLTLPVMPQAQTILGEEPALGDKDSRTTQHQILAGTMSLTDIRRAGLTLFATQFRRSDGYGDGPLNPLDTTTPGGRPMLQDNGTFLRVNGLDSQSCLDCHSIISADSMPMTLGVGGAGGVNNSAMFMTRAIDVADINGNGFAAFDGRLINPPALFGTGGVQLVAREMTVRLQALKARAIDNPGKTIRLRAKGVKFGTIVADAAGRLDTSAVEGIDADLIVRPFGRKGEFASVRSFDLGALMFHMGMQPVEAVGLDIDADGDGVTNEVITGEVSALEIFVTTQETPVQLPVRGPARDGKRRFRGLGCAGCHKPVMRASSPVLSYSQPEIEDDPLQNIFYSVNMAQAPPKFQRGPSGSIEVPMFSDLKRHDMGERLAEAFHGADDQLNNEFITAKLWGVADTAPYLHDGRAFTLHEAIMLHGGEARTERDEYEALSVEQKNELLAFLRTLRNPRSPNSDVLQ